LYTLESKASKVVSLQEGLGIVDTTREVADIDTGERICCTGVAANLDDVGVFCRKDCDVGLLS
jgi:hypothetical protein